MDTEEIEKKLNGYLVKLRISSASIDPKRDKERALGFKAGYAAATPPPTPEDEKELIHAFGRFLLLNDTSYETGRNDDWGRLNFDDKVNTFFTEKNDYLKTPTPVKEEGKEDKINYGTMVDPERLYPVTYTVSQDRIKEYKLTFLKGKDMTENQIKIWLHFLAAAADKSK